MTEYHRNPGALPATSERRCWMCDKPLRRERFTAFGRTRSDALNELPEDAQWEEEEDRGDLTAGWRWRITYRWPWGVGYWFSRDTAGYFCTLRCGFRYGIATAKEKERAR